jgi:REP element-mobilizing transposase RayT
MPDHAHMIFTPLINEGRCMAVSLAEIMKGIKGSSAHAINHRLSRNGSIWQEESFDHVLRSSESLDQKVRYVLENPVRGKLVRDWHDDRWLWRQPA